MGGCVTGVVGVDGVVLVGGVAALPDELHAAAIDASATPTMSIERIRFMTASSFPPASERSIRCGS
jgi:hypothetical protein